MAKNHFYNLPNAWNPGYADPEYVLEDGLQRRASVTPMTPRGTYDDPKVGSGGYALPNYIGKEGYGQGTYTTKWEKRGSFDTPAIPQLSGMGDIAYQPSNVFGQFGAKAATRIVARIMRLPASQRRDALKAALDKIDPTLFSRAERYTNENIARKMHPRKALVSGLAKAMSEGMLEELDRAGRTGTAPQAKTLPGLGCYGAKSALGAFDLKTSVSGVKGRLTGTPTCPPPAGYTWDFSTNPPFVRRLKVGESPVNGPCGTTVTTGGTSGQATVADSTTPRAGQYLQLGPSADRIWFSIPTQTGRFRITPTTNNQYGQPIGADIWSDIVAQLQKASDTYRKLRSVNVDVGKDLKGDGYGLPSGNYLQAVLDGKFPLYNFTYPGTSTRYGAFLKYISPGSWEMTTRNTEPTDPISKGLDALKRLFAKIVDTVKDVVEEVADMACELVNNPNAPAAAGAASGPGAAIGVGAAQAACGRGGQQTPTTVPVGTGADIGTIVLVGGGVLLVAALTKKRKKKGQSK